MPTYLSATDFASDLSDKDVHYYNYKYSYSVWRRYYEDSTDIDLG